MSTISFDFSLLSSLFCSPADSTASLTFIRITNIIYTQYKNISVATIATALPPSLQFTQVVLPYLKYVSVSFTKHTEHNGPLYPSAQLEFTPPKHESPKGLHS